ncbi:WAS/WASL-interacting protein family member 3-like [Orcinus orca]|uniref:WAS/WASL-interacting protein family member 3-like n=1 Tax=Orcinus orca TaxID=9733 RepID=UPI00211219AF|nr:WAS/WASL-interacting protein family member 3-like [Orcinus orca]
MSVSGLCSLSRGSRPSLELSQAGFLIPSPRAPGNKEGRKSLLPLRQVQTPPRTLSRLAAAHQRPAGCVHAANLSPLPALRQKPEPQLPVPPAPAGEQTSLSLVSAGRPDPLRWNLSALLSAPLLLCSPPLLPSSPTPPPEVSTREGAS